MIKSESIKNLVAALSKAQAEFPAVPRDRTVTVTSKRTGGKYTFAYAPLETIMHAVRPVLKNNGLAFLQTVSGEALTTLLMHTSGEWIESDPLPIKATEEGAQAQGSAITYARRYALTAMLGIVTEDDDDGNAADGNALKHAALRPGDGAGKIRPAEGLLESLSPDMQDWCRDLAHRVETLHRRKDTAGAWDEWSQSVHESDEITRAAAWDLMPSDVRSALKKESTTRKAAA